MITLTLLNALQDVLEDPYRKDWEFLEQGLPIRRAS